MPRTRPLLAAVLLPAILLPACAVQQDHKRMARAFLNGRTAEEALAPASMNFTYYDGPADPHPMTRDEFRDAIQWDVTLNRVNEIHQMHSRTDTATVTFHETNDFAQLLGHPGWDATLIFSFDDDRHGGLITQALYQPAPDNAPIQPYLDAALPYLRANHPDALEVIYPNDHIVMTAEAARTWKRLLIEWRASAAGG